MKNIQHFILLVLFITVSLKLAAQEPVQPKASVTIKTVGTTSPILQYLINKYGAEDSERILLNIKDYESTYKVFVLTDSQYENKVESINKKINLTDNHEEKEVLIARKNTFINLISIETLVTK